MGSTAVELQQRWKYILLLLLETSIGLHQHNALESYQHPTALNLVSHKSDTVTLP